MKMEFKSGNVEATRALSTGYISTGMKPTMTAALDLQAGERDALQSSSMQRRP